MSIRPKTGIEITDAALDYLVARKGQLPRCIRKRGGRTAKARRKQRQAAAALNQLGERHAKRGTSERPVKRPWERALQGQKAKYPPARRRWLSRATVRRVQRRGGLCNEVAR